MKIKIEPGTKVTLNIKVKTEISDVDETLMLNSVVEESPTKGVVIIQMPIYHGFYYPLPRDEIIEMSFLSKSSLYTMNAQFDKRVERGSFVFARMKQVGDITEQQRRDCYRLECSLPAKITRNVENEEGEIEEQQSSCVIVNISDGGVLLATDEEISIGERFVLNFKINASITIEGLALRSHMSKSGSYTYRIGVEFINATRSQKNHIFKYIVARQRELARRSSKR